MTIESKMAKNGVEMYFEVDENGKKKRIKPTGAIIIDLALKTRDEYRAKINAERDEILSTPLVTVEAQDAATDGEFANCARASILAFSEMAIAFNAEIKKALAAETEMHRNVELELAIVSTAITPAALDAAAQAEIDLANSNAEPDENYVDDSDGNSTATNANISNRFYKVDDNGNLIQISYEQMKAETDLALAKFCGLSLEEYAAINAEIELANVNNDNTDDSNDDNGGNGTVDTANNLPTGNITVNSGAVAWAIVGKYFPNGIHFNRASKGFNREDVFSFTYDDIIYANATCTPDNRRIDCIDVINSNESGSARHLLNVFISHDFNAEIEPATAYTPQINWVNPHVFSITGDLSERNINGRIIAQRQFTKGEHTLHDDFNDKLAKLQANANDAKANLAEKQAALDKAQEEFLQADSDLEDANRAINQLGDAKAKELRDTLFTTELLNAPKMTITAQNGNPHLTKLKTLCINFDCFDHNFFITVDKEASVITFKLATYDTTEQVTCAVNLLKDAIKRGDKEFTFPTADELNQPSATDFTSAADLQKAFWDGTLPATLANKIRVALKKARDAKRDRIKKSGRTTRCRLVISEVNAVIDNFFADVYKNNALLRKGVA